MVPNTTETQTHCLIAGIEFIDKASEHELVYAAQGRAYSSVHTSHMPLKWCYASNWRVDNTWFDTKFKSYLIWHKVCLHKATYQNILNKSELL